MEYIIVGDTERYKECLVFTCGKNKEHAESVLHKILTNPSKEEAFVIRNMKNLKVIVANGGDCWWNDPVLAN